MLMAIENLSNISQEAWTNIPRTEVLIPVEMTVNMEVEVEATIGEIMAEMMTFTEVEETIGLLLLLFTALLEEEEEVVTSDLPLTIEDLNGE